MMCHHFCNNCSNLELRPNNCECTELFTVKFCEECSYETS